MSVELKVFSGALFVKDKALKKDPDLKPLAIAVKATNKGMAEAIIAGKFAENFPANIEDYFKAKIWEDRVGLPRAEIGTFCTDFFETVAVWDSNKCEPVASPVEGKKLAADVMKAVSILDQHSRAACLALFGSVSEITSAQYGQVIDLINDDESSFARELAEAIVKESRVLALIPERQEQILVYVREKASESAQWPDIKKMLTKWLETPAEKREELASAKQTSEQDMQARLRYNIARGIIARNIDFDIDNTPIGIVKRVNVMMLDKNDTSMTSWLLILSRTPGIYDFHPAFIIAMIKTCEEGVSSYPGEVRKYIDSIVETLDCKNPDQRVIDIACGHSSLPLLPQEINHDETQSAVPGETLTTTIHQQSDDEFNAEIDTAIKRQDLDETGRQLAAGRGEFVPGISDPAESNWVDGKDPREDMSDREIEIAHALNDLISGRTMIMSEDEATGVMACTGHLPAHALPLLIADITTTEFSLSPDFSDEEIHDIATTILDSWSDDINARQQIALNAIVEYRSPVPPAKTITAPAVPDECKKEDLSPINTVQIVESVNQGTLTYRQQLTIAALQGLCANPAFSRAINDIPEEAVNLAREILEEESRYE